MRFRSARFHLTTVFVLTLGLILSCGAGTFYLWTWHNERSQLDLLLKITASDTATAFRENEPDFDIQEIAGQHLQQQTTTPVRALDLAIRDVNGRILRHSHGFNLFISNSDPSVRRALSRFQPSYETLGHGEEAVRLLNYPVRLDGNRGVVLIEAAAPSDPVEDSLLRLGETLAAGVIVALMAAGTGAWIVVGRTLRPIDQLAMDAQRISSHNLHERLAATETDSEIGRLVSTLNDMVSRLEVSFESQRRFTADASHELRTPLTILRGQIEVALARARSVEEYQAVIRSASEEIDRMDCIVNDLLMLARADAGQVALELEPVALDQVCQTVVDHFAQLAAHKHQSLEAVKLERVVMIGDASRLHRMVSNLVDNAIKYTADGGAICLELQQDKANAQLKVKDTGCGMPEPQINRIFERFYRIDKGRSRDLGGSGLGLAIVHWIAEAHHGAIQVESKPGHGSAFTVTLPLVPPGDISEL